MDEPSSQRELHSMISRDRIQQLNQMDKDVTQMLRSAGLAIQAMTNPKSGSSPAPDESLDSHKQRFKDASDQYLAMLSSIDVRLRRQVYATEERGILSREATDNKPAITDTSLGAPATAVNPLEVSRLNARKDTVGQDKEAEMWAAARIFFEKVAKPESGQDGPADDPDNMQMD